jgi:hypothetical protein
MSGVHPGHGHDHGHDRDHDHDHDHDHHHHRVFIGDIGWTYYDYPYSSCWRWVHVQTRHGWRWRHINVCY